MAYVLIKFANSPRPDLWVLERSTDFGLTYEPWQYFACKYSSVTRELEASMRLGLELFLCRCCDLVCVLDFFCPIRLQELKLGAEQLGEVVVLLRTGGLFCFLGLCFLKYWCPPESMWMLKLAPVSTVGHC